MEPSRNFDLRLSGTLAAVSVEVDSPAGQYTAPAALPCTISPQALEDLRDAMPGVDLKAIGTALWRCAFGDPVVRGLWERSRPDPGSEDILRLRLIIDAAELAALPWELLYDETLGRFLALDAQTPVTRFTRLPIASAPWPQDRPLRLLFTGASPDKKYSNVHIDPQVIIREWEGIERAVAPLVKARQLETKGFLEGATMDALVAALPQKADIWHFVGHGHETGLLFVEAQGRPKITKAESLSQLFTGGGVRLVVLNTCLAGAGGGQADSVAGALLRAGIPAVVAMQAEVSTVVADVFARAFYGAIAAGQDVDQSVTAARKAIWAAETSEWWIPALFMRTPEGRIWRVPVKGAETEERARELAYLDGVIEKYKYWAEKYTPLAGIAEVQVAAADSQQLDLPDPFIPTGFEKLVEHGFGMERRTERVPVDDLREAVAKYRRLVILGEPGSGKTTTLWRLAYDYAVAARKDPQAPLPLLVPLEAYSGPESAFAYIQSYFEELSPHLSAFLRSKRVILLLDALNQMPQTDRKERVERIQTLLDQHPNVSVVVTCRALDYVETLKLEKLEVKPLEPEQQRAYLHRYLDKSAGEKLFWQLCGGEEISDLWRTWQRAGGMWEQFWTATDIPDGLQLWRWGKDAELWRTMRKDGLPPLLALGRNPFMLVMLAQVYKANKGVLPQNRGRLFAAFVDTLLGREERRCDPSIWPGADPLRQGMASLAYAMQEAGERGTAVDVGWAIKQMAQRGVDEDKVAYLCASATLLDIFNSQVRFIHQQVQEYFAALAVASRLEHGDNLRQYWPTDWTQPSGWEETFILMAGMLPDMTSLIERLLPVNPRLAARCIAESGGERPAKTTTQAVQQHLVHQLKNPSAKIAQRDAAGKALNILGDTRPGVGLRPDGLPDIDWVFVPDRDPVSERREFIFGADSESNRQERTEPDFWMARYPITYLQFHAFLDTPSGFPNDLCWQGMAVERGHRASPGEQWDKYWNHPRDNVSWYDAMAFCRWLTAMAKDRVNLLPARLDRGRDWTITLPTEWQWEKAARGHDGRQYPWGDKRQKADVLIDETSNKAVLSRFYDGLSAVGLFAHMSPHDSPYGIADLIGSVTEWCLNDFHNPELFQEEVSAFRVIRGSAYGDDSGIRPAPRRMMGHPRLRGGGHSFRVAVNGFVTIS